MTLLILSIVALAFGPGIVSFAGARSWVLALVDGFVVVTIGGIVLIHILPHALLSCGAWALVGASVGLIGPALFERRDHAHHDDPRGGDRSKHRPALALALLGVAMHAFLDGSAFAEHGVGHGHPHDHGAELLGLAVVLHRIPEGLAIWWLVRPREGGPRMAFAALGVVAVATLLGARFGDELVHGARAAVFAFVQAMVSGSLLHVVIHHAPPSTAWQHHHHHARGRGRAAGPRRPHEPRLGHAHPRDASGSPVMAPPVLEPPARGRSSKPVASSPLVSAGASTAFSWGLSPSNEEPRAAYLSLVEPDPHHDRGVQIAPAIGALVGTVLLFVVSSNHPTAQRIAHEIAMGPTFVTLALESAPALLVAYVASGVVHAFLPRGVVTWLAKGSTFTQSLRGLLVGPLLPVCSCGVLPLYRTMLARGAPRAAALTLLVAAPEIGLATFLISWSLLGARLTLVRGLAAVLTAVLVGYGVTRLGRRSPRSESPAALPSIAPPQRYTTRLWAGLRYGLGDTVDHTTPWIVLGLAVASFAEPLLDAEMVAGVSPWIEVPTFAALGVPMYVCASGATPLVAVLLHKGISPGAAIAFLLTGPATNLTTFGVLKSLHGRRLATWFAAAMVIVPTVLGWVTNLAVPRDRSQALHTAAHEPATTIELLSLVVLGALVAVSLLRHGPRHMVSQLIASSAHEH